MYPQVIGLALVLGLASAYPSSIRAPIGSQRREGKISAQDGKLGMWDGQSTNIKAHPYVVGILVDDVLKCTGAILTEEWVIGLAGCFYNATTSDVKVVAGSNDGTSGTSYSVEKLVTHPNYVSTSYDYDYTLVKIKSSFTWSDKVGNLSLPSRDVSVNTKLTVVSYGSNYKAEGESGVGSSGTMAQGTMKWLKRGICTSDYEDLDIQVTARMGCAYNNGKTTLCEGDWGAPFIQTGVLYGLFAVGAYDNFCTPYARPVIVADIFPVVNWIQTYTGATTS